MRKRTILLIAAGLLFATPVTVHALTGAIFTTLENGSRVNANIYQAQEDVYLDGGPGQNAPPGAAGLLEGDYYYQVTDPSGKVLLSLDPVKCRKFRVNSYGVIGQVYSAICSERIKGKLVEVECTHNIGIDIDYSKLGAITVQLMRYARTPNSGNVYKVWVTPVASFSGNPELIDNGYSPGNYHGFIPAFCKTDAFKVLRGKPFDPPILKVRKFHDLNANGSRDQDDLEITGWQIEITDPLGVVNIYYTPVLIQAMPEGTWTVFEKVPPEHWLQTALYVDSASQTVGPEAQVQVVGLSGETHLIVYGNIQTGDIVGCKWYDRNADGFQNSTEPGISDWLIELVGTSVNGSSVSLSGYTDSSGCIAFTNLLPGNYTINEKIPLIGWFGSTPTSFAIDLVGGAIKTREFGNFCVSWADFDTKGAWHKSRFGEISQSNIDYVNGLDPYDSDTEYWQSEPFDGSWTPLNPGQYFGAGAWAEISDYLVSPVSSAPARFQLAQQLLALTFNCLHSLDSPGAAIQLPDGTWKTANDLINEAISAWASGTDSEQTSIKDLLDLLNNNDSVPFICYNPCSVVYP